MTAHVVPLDQKVKEKKFVTKARTGRGHHHLPKIKECLRRSSNWVELTNKDQYEFPGFDAASGTKQRTFAFVKDCRKLEFAPSNRTHFIWDDNQLSKWSTQTAKHNIVIVGVSTLLNVKRGPCEGVKKSAGTDCSYVVSNRQKLNRCVHHKDSFSLVSTGVCPMQMVYTWPSCDDGLGLCQAQNTITLEQHHISCRAKSKKASEKWYLMIVLKVPKIS